VKQQHGGCMFYNLVFGFMAITNELLEPGIWNLVRA